jgi:hypothetical protein
MWDEITKIGHILGITVINVIVKQLLPFPHRAAMCNCAKYTTKLG